MRCRLPSLLVIAALGGCAQPEWLCINPQGVRSITVRSDATAARTRAIAVDLVSVTEPTLAGEIAQLPARDFYARREQLVRDHPRSLHLVSLELAPDQSVGPVSVDTPCEPEATFVFASYDAPGEHRARLDGADVATVVLGDRGFVVAAP
ncbi:MAG: hypothetical protein ACLFU0_11775 [Alphaproteobacteria bacterium]